MRNKMYEAGKRQVWIDQKLHEELKDSAEKNHRKITDEAEVAVEFYLTSGKKKA